MNLYPRIRNPPPFESYILKSICSLLVLILTCFQSPNVFANYAQRKDVQTFINKMVTQYGVYRAHLTQQFAAVKRLDKVLVSIAKPAEKTLTWKQYRPIFLSDKRIEKGKKFLRDNHALLARAEQKYGVPAEIIAAIIGVETYYGRHTGKYTVFDSLTTLSFDYPPRAKFFKSELKAFLLLSKEEHISIDEMTGSYAGAMGMPQFISSSYREYAVDFDGDGKRDLWNSLPDVIGSVANYFNRHGWKLGDSVTHQVEVKNTSIVRKKNTLKPYALISQLENQGVTFNAKTTSQSLDKKQMATLLHLKGKKGDEYWLGLNNFYVITRYNHSVLYAMAVYQLSEKLKQ